MLKGDKLGQYLVETGGGCTDRLVVSICVPADWLMKPSIRFDSIDIFVRVQTHNATHTAIVSHVARNKDTMKALLPLYKADLAAVEAYVKQQLTTTTAGGGWVGAFCCVCIYV